jgi:hypothetical protein
MAAILIFVAFAPSLNIETGDCQMQNLFALRLAHQTLSLIAYSSVEFYANLKTPDG